MRVVCRFFRYLAVLFKKVSCASLTRRGFFLNKRENRAFFSVNRLTKIVSAKSTLQKTYEHERKTKCEQKIRSTNNNSSATIDNKLVLNETETRWTKKNENNYFFSEQKKSKINSFQKKIFSTCLMLPVTGKSSLHLKSILNMAAVIFVLHRWPSTGDRLFFLRTFRTQSTTIFVFCFFFF